MTPPPDPRELAELHARVHALEAWRAHHTDLLNSLLNPDTDPADDSDNNGDGADPDPLDVTLDSAGLIAWAHQHVTGIIARPLRGEHAWCPQWWDHTEAVFRFTALHRAWAELAPEPGAAMSIWIRDHLDPCLRELLHPAGPFADCATTERRRVLDEHRPVPTLPTADPPGG